MYDRAERNNPTRRLIFKAREQPNGYTKHRRDAKRTDPKIVSAHPAPSSD
jgi:hypothetical protein